MFFLTVISFFFRINRLFVGWPVNPDMNTWRYRFETDIYFVPWARISAYLIGMLAGFFLFKTDRKLKISKVSFLISKNSFRNNKHFSNLMFQLFLKLSLKKTLCFWKLVFYFPYQSKQKVWIIKVFYFSYLKQNYQKWTI